MAILWAGGEDIDFPNGAGVAVGTGTYGRAGFSRCYVTCAIMDGKTWTGPFVGGAVTSCWMTVQMGWNWNGNTTLATGLVNTASLNASGVFVAVKDIGGSATLALYKYDGSTSTLLASSSTLFYAGNTNTQHRLDLQVSSYGSSGTLNLYVDGGLAVTYTGNIAVGSVTNLDGVAIVREGNNNAFSEIIVADEDTRAFVGLVTMAPTAAGTTDAWAGAFTDVNEVSVNDSTMISTNTITQDEQFNVTDMPTGNFSIKAVVVAARATSTATATATKVALGFNSGGTVAVGTSQLTTTAWVRYSQIFAQNPVTSANWLLSDMNALQIDLRSGS